MPLWTVTGSEMHDKHKAQALAMVLELDEDIQNKLTKYTPSIPPILVAIPYYETFDSAQTQNIIKKAFNRAWGNNYVKSIVLVESRNGAPKPPSWKLPLNMRPVDFELACNNGLRKYIFGQQYVWRVEIAMDMLPSVHF